MTLTRSLLISVAFIMGLAALVLGGLSYYSVKEETYQRLYQESEAIYNFLMSVRRVYQKQFLESGVPLNDRTVGFLPAHSLPRISKEFSQHWDQRGIQIKTASDRPRNPRNRADAGELEAIAWFNADDERSVYTKQEEKSFLYVRPVWVVKSCLKCHGDPEKAPPTIRERYQQAFGYEVGDLRGVVSVRIPMERVEETLMGSFLPRFAVLLAAFLLIVLAIYGVVRRLIHTPVSEMVEGVRQISSRNQSYRLAPQKGELGEFVEHFNQMMGRQQELHGALTEQKKKMEQVLESMDEGVVVTDTQGRILHLNHRLEEWSGWPSVAHFGAPIETLFDEQQSIRTRAEGGGRLKLRCLDQETIPVHVSVGVLNREAGDGWGGEGEVWVLHDLRERLRAEQQEEFAAYQAGIAEMSTMILHNVGNALTAIDGGLLRLKNQMRVLKQVDKLFDRGVQLIDQIDKNQLEQSGVTEQLESVRDILEQGNSQVIKPLAIEIERDSLKPIEHSVRHMSEIIRAQQGSAKVATRATRFSLQEVVDDALVMQQDTLNKLGIEVVQSREEALLDVYLPRNQMVQALNNLLKNSHESIADQMAERAGTVGKLEISLKQTPEWSLLEVKDNGVGVDQAQQQEVFDFGYTSKERGSGFGLHATANFIHNLGGELSLQSGGVGQGATVTIRVPNEVADERVR